jgi:hypothetical protein
MDCEFVAPLDTGFKILLSRSLEERNTSALLCRSRKMAEFHEYGAPAWLTDLSAAAKSYIDDVLDYLLVNSSDQSSSN